MDSLSIFGKNVGPETYDLDWQRKSVSVLAASYHGFSTAETVLKAKGRGGTRGVDELDFKLKNFTENGFSGWAEYHKMVGLFFLFGNREEGLEALSCCLCDQDPIAPTFTETCCVALSAYKNAQCRAFPLDRSSGAGRFGERQEVLY